MIKSVFPTRELWVYSSEPNHQGIVTALIVMADDYPERLILQTDMLKIYNEEGTLSLPHRTVLNFPLLVQDQLIEDAVTKLLEQDDYHEATPPSELRDFDRPASLAGD